MLQSLLEKDDQRQIKTNNETNLLISETDDDKIHSHIIFLILNKIDAVVNSTNIPRISSFAGLSASYHSSIYCHEVSCVTGEGVNEFECALSEVAMSIIPGSIDKKTSISHENALITRDRHRHHLKQCLSHLNEFLDGNSPMDIAAEELRLAMMELGKITGRVDVEELLDVIFRDFCIGK